MTVIHQFIASFNVRYKYVDDEESKERHRLIPTRCMGPKRNNWKCLCNPLLRSFDVLKMSVMIMVLAS